MTDGQVLASYLGADRGVGFMYDPGVILIGMTWPLFVVADLRPSETQRIVA